MSFHKVWSNYYNPSNFSLFVRDINNVSKFCSSIRLVMKPVDISVIYFFLLS